MMNSGSQLLHFLERANQAAMADGLSELARQIMALLLEAGRAQAGVFYVIDTTSGELVCKAALGFLEAEQMIGKRCHVDAGFAGLVWRGDQPVWLPMGAQDPRWKTCAILPPGYAPGAAYGLPLKVGEKPGGVVMLFEPAPEALEILPVLANRLAPDVGRALRLEAAQETNCRLEEMIRIFGQIGATLDRDQILRGMIDFARTVINAEASSLFLVDEATNDIVLHLTSNVQNDQSLEQVRVPPGKGIIGHVVATGETVLVPDVKQDTRHYSGVDQSSGFVTRAILAAPLRSRQVVLGGERGTIEERIIGGFEALNKFEGTFGDQDAQLMVTLANQAATVLEIANLYADANELFLNVIEALTESIDAKDKTTEGHSRRVSDFTVEIARELGRPPEEVHRLHIGSLLHDVGKIGIPDNILNKPGKLTDEEYTIMKTHPTIGSNIMSQVRMLRADLPALSQHHERLDGRGYPLGLKRDEISLAGRIVAVADVFDALTSDRPYRAALSPKEALDYLQQGIGSQFDEQCVLALMRCCMRGCVKTQKESNPLKNR